MTFNFLTMKVVAFALSTATSTIATRTQVLSRVCAMPTCTHSHTHTHTHTHSLSLSLSFFLSISIPLLSLSLSVCPSLAQCMYRSFCNSQVTLHLVDTIPTDQCSCQHCPLWNLLLLRSRAGSVDATPFPQRSCDRGRGHASSPVKDPESYVLTLV